MRNHFYKNHYKMDQDPKLQLLKKFTSMANFINQIEMIIRDLNKEKMTIKSLDHQDNKTIIINSDSLKINKSIIRKTYYYLIKFKSKIPRIKLYQIKKSKI